MACRNICKFWLEKLKESAYTQVLKTSFFKKIEQDSGMKINDIKKQIEDQIFNKVGIQTQSCVAFYGGFNNLFFLTHYSQNTKKPMFITKLSESYLAERECTLLAFQETDLNNINTIGPRLIAFITLENNLALLTTSFLQNKKNYSQTQVLELYTRLGIISNLMNESNYQSLTPLEPKTKITSLLVNVVQQVETPHAYEYISSFLIEREALFNDPVAYRKTVNMAKEIIDLAVDNPLLVRELYGLVHGDFKNSNVLVDDENKLLLIDFQYVTYGVRLWDIAFYLSKKPKGFENFLNEGLNIITSTVLEKKIFLMFYLLASLLHIRPNNSEVIMSKVLNNVLNYYRKII